MPREPWLFLSSSGSAIKGFLKLRGNVTPRWIENARTSRKRLEPVLVKSFTGLERLQRRRPRAQVTIKHANAQLRALLKAWEVAYEKENFYRGIRILLELKRSGSSEF
jgi:hypothetical protein